CANHIDLWRRALRRLLILRPLELEAGFVGHPRIDNHSVTHLQGVFAIAAIKALRSQRELSGSIVALVDADILVTREEGIARIKLIIHTQARRCEQARIRNRLTERGWIEILIER